LADYPYYTGTVLLAGNLAQKVGWDKDNTKYTEHGQHPNYVDYVKWHSAECKQDKQTK